MRNHDAIINAEPLIHGKYTATSLLGHARNHFLKPLIAAHATNDKDLATAHMRHGPLRNLNQHGKDCLLQREAEILDSEARTLGSALQQLRGQGLCAGEDAGEGAVHALDNVGELEQLLALLGQLLDVVARRGVVADVEHAGEAVEAVADGDVERLAKDAVPLLGVGNDLGVAAADVQHDGVICAGDLAAHLDVSDAVVDADEGLIPEEGQGARADGDAGEGRAHAGALGEADAVDVGGGDARLGDGAAGEGDELSAVVEGGVFGEEARAWRGDECVSQVGEDGGGGWGVADEADAELVGGAFAAECDPGGFVGHWRC